MGDVLRVIFSLCDLTTIESRVKILCLFLCCTWEREREAGCFMLINLVLLSSLIETTLFQYRSYQPWCHINIDQTMFNAAWLLRVCLGLKPGREFPDQMARHRQTQPKWLGFRLYPRDQFSGLMTSPCLASWRQVRFRLGLVFLVNSASCARQRH